MTSTAPFGARLDDVFVQFGKGRRMLPNGTLVKDEASTALDGATVTIRPGTITGGKSVV